MVQFPRKRVGKILARRRREKIRFYKFKPIFQRVSTLNLPDFSKKSPAAGGRKKNNSNLILEGLYWNPEIFGGEVRSSSERILEYVRP